MAPSMASPAIEPPFGTYALPGWAERLRRLAQHTGRGNIARRVSSLIRRLCLVGRPDPIDIEPFPGQRARLYPRDNLSEKRVFGGAQFWDFAERKALEDVYRRTEGRFCFVDAGANAGLYTLAVRSFGEVDVLAVEPDTENRRRLTDNLKASGARDVHIAPVALSDGEGTLMLSTGEGNRGEISLAGPGNGDPVRARPLLDLVREAGMPRIDALKIDIEGAEEIVLNAFFKDAPVTLWPNMVLIEARRGEETEALLLLRRHGYDVVERTRMNAIMILSAARMAPAKAGDQHGEA